MYLANADEFVVIKTPNTYHSRLRLNGHFFKDFDLTENLEITAGKVFLKMLIKYKGSFDSTECFGITAGNLLLRACR